jgi:hypothetical protein
MISMPFYHSAADGWIEHPAQRNQQTMQRSINGLPSGSAGMTQGFQNTYFPFPYASNNYPTVNGRANYHPESFRPHSYNYDEIHSSHSSIGSHYGAPGVVHHVMHHVQHLQPVSRNHQIHQFQQFQQFQQLEQSRRIRHTDGTLQRPPQNAVEQAFSRALQAIGDNDNRITSHSVSSYLPSPTGRKRRRIDPPVVRPATPDIREVIEIEDSDGRNIAPASPDHSTAVSSPSSSVTSIVTTAESVANLEQTITDDMDIAKKTRGSRVSLEQDTSMASVIDRNSLEVPGSDLVIAPEYEAALELSQVEANLQKLLHGLDGLGVSQCREKQEEYECILYEMYFRARRDAYHEVKAQKIAETTKQLAEVCPKEAKEDEETPAADEVAVDEAQCSKQSEKAVIGELQQSEVEAGH